MFCYHQHPWKKTAANNLQIGVTDVSISRLALKLVEVSTFFGLNLRCPFATCGSQVFYILLHELCQITAPWILIIIVTLDSELVSIVEGICYVTQQLRYHVSNRTKQLAVSSNIKP
jgi:hypothetical protein